MNDRELPDELKRLESELSSLPQPSAPSGLQATVFRDVRTELRGRRRRRTYGYAACAAIAAAVWANLSFSAARETDYHLRNGTKPVSVAPMTEQLLAILPDLDPQVAQRHASMLRVACEFQLRPELPPGPVSDNRSSGFTPRSP